MGRVVAEESTEQKAFELRPGKSEGGSHRRSGARLSQNAELVPWSISRVCLRNLGQKQESSRSVHSQAHLLTRTTVVSYCLPATPLGCRQVSVKNKRKPPTYNTPGSGGGGRSGLRASAQDASLRTRSVLGAFQTYCLRWVSP